MKYLKKYKLFENVDSINFEKIKSECEWILMELIDDGFDVEITGKWFEPGASFVSNIDITIQYLDKDTHLNVKFNYSKIKTNIEHLLSYMSDNFKYPRIFITSNSHYKTSLKEIESDIRSIYFRFLEK